jgi:ribosomal protein S9
MSSLYNHNRLAEATSTRLSVVTGTAAELIAQLSELNELRERVRKAQLSARRSRRIDCKKRMNRYSRRRSQTALFSGTALSQT